MAGQFPQQEGEPRLHPNPNVCWLVGSPLGLVVNRAAGPVDGTGGSDRARSAALLADLARQHGHEANRQHY